jgi:hypothetical protein
LNAEKAHVVEKGGRILAHIHENPPAHVLAFRFQEKGDSMLSQERALVLDRILRQNRDLQVRK